jgi:hypothetical protein
MTKHCRQLAVTSAPLHVVLVLPHAASPPGTASLPLCGLSRHGARASTPQGMARLCSMAPLTTPQLGMAISPADVGIRGYPTRQARIRAGKSARERGYEQEDPPADR